MLARHGRHRDQGLRVKVREAEPPRLDVAVIVVPVLLAGSGTRPVNVQAPEVALAVTVVTPVVPTVS
jgi:hypothetical protein